MSKWHGFLLIVGLPTCIFFVGYIFRGLVDFDHFTNRQAFEAGAWTIVKHHAEYGNYGSRAYRDEVYLRLVKTGDLPQNGTEVREIVDYVDKKFTGFTNLKEVPNPNPQRKDREYGNKKSNNRQISR